VAVSLFDLWNPLERSSDITVERETFLMGTVLRASVTAANKEAGVEAIEAVVEEISRLEAMLSSWREDSELSRLNAAPPGIPQVVSGELFALLREVEGWAELSGGSFDPAVGPLVDAWDLRGVGRVPSDAELADALQASGLGAFELDESTGRVTREYAGAWMTAGGFGKGAALRAARGVLEAEGVESATLDFGGQLLVLGSRDTGWTVGVAHPAHRQLVIAKLELQEGSAATSAASERYVEIGGTSYGHILDPRSGRPVPAWGSVTVVAEDPLLSDVVATTLFVLGPDAGMAWAESLQDVGVLFLRLEGETVTAAWNRVIEPRLLEVPES
jgi:thiamine biosynthesis lipoprotein